MKAKGLIGKKVGMTRVFSDNGRSIPVTVIHAGGCVVLEKKTIESCGYKAIKVGYDQISIDKVSKPEATLFKKNGLTNGLRRVNEFLFDEIDQFNEGEVVSLDIFDGCETVAVTGVSKGRGFAGTIKRHNFNRGPMSHGSKNVRDPGSIGQHSYPGNVFKGKKMAGRMGNERVKIKNLEVVKLLKEDGLILVKGSVPGPNGGYVFITVR